MARRPSKHLRPARPLSTSLTRGETKRDGEWGVQTIVGGRSTKEYLCPGCNRAIPAGTPHVVVWPRVPRIGSSSAVADRRHWHGPCWNRRR